MQDVKLWEQDDWEKLQAQLQDILGWQELTGNAVASLDGRLDVAEPKLNALLSWKLSVDASVKALEEGVTALKAADTAMTARMVAVETWRPSVNSSIKALEDAVAALKSADTAMVNRVAAIEAGINVLKQTDTTLGVRMTAAEAEVVKLKAEDVALKAEDVKLKAEDVTIDKRLDVLEAKPAPPTETPKPAEEPDAPL